MRKILTVKELITLLLDYNMDALVYTNANGVPTGISLPNVCYGGGGDGETKKDCKEVIFDIQEEENEHIAVALEEFVDPYNGHAYVDFGLPSGTKWATMNVGANSETDYGLYFAWGETQGYTASQVGSDIQFSWDDYKYGTSSSNFTEYNSTDGKTTLDLEDDAAHVNWGGQWHIPTKEQCEELFNTEYVTNQWVNDYQGSGINGRLFTSVINGNTMFVPAAGYCGEGKVYYLHEGYFWASALYSEGDDVAWNFYFNSDEASVNVNVDGSRYYGQSVRGVVSLAEKNIRRKV